MWPCLNYLREFVLTTVIMAPGACRTQGRSRPGWLHFRKFRIFRIWIPGASFGVIKTMVLALLGGKLIIEIHVNLISTAEFAWKLNTHVCPHIQNFDFYGRICLKVETRIYTQVHEIFGPPPRGPQRAPGVQRPPQDLFQRQILYIQTPDQPQSGRYS